MLKEKYEFKLFADYHQFYLQDEEAHGDLSNSWTATTNTRLRCGVVKRQVRRLLNGVLKINTH